MAKIIILAGLAIAAYWAWRWYQRQPHRGAGIMNGATAVSAILFLALAMSGHLSWPVAIVLAILPVLPRLGLGDKRDTRADAAPGVGNTGRRDTPRASPGGQMDADEARRILGVSGSASREDIVTAHRRLMQKMHPDRGGSAHLAAQINRAKDILLGE